MEQKDLAPKSYLTLFEHYKERVELHIFPVKIVYDYCNNFSNILSLFFPGKEIIVNTSFERQIVQLNPVIKFKTLQG